MIWLRRNDQAIGKRDAPSRAVQQATATLLAQSFVGDDGSDASSPTAQGSVKKGPRMIRRPQKVTETDIVVCSYSSPAGSNRWKFIATTYVLVKGPDVIVVMEKAKARTADQDYVYEGLVANGTGKASSVIAGIDKDSSIPIPLRNGCMWPSGKHTVKDIGSTRRLGPRNGK